MSRRDVDDVQFPAWEGNRLQPADGVSPPSTWRLVRQLIDTDPMLRMYAVRSPPTGHDRLTPGEVDARPRHSVAAAGSVAVSADALLLDTGLAERVFGRTTTLGMTGLRTLVEYFVRPLLRVFRTSVDTYGRPMVDPASDEVFFELGTDHLPTGRVLVTGPPAPLDHRPVRPATIDTLVDAFVRAGPPAAVDERTVRREVTDAIAAELRYLRPHTARLLSEWPCWAPYVHSVPQHQDALLQRVVDQVRTRASAHRADASTPAPVVLVPPEGAMLPGLDRFGREIAHLGGELRIGTEIGDDVVAEIAVRGGDTVRTFERSPTTWRRPPARAPHVSYATSLANLPLGDLRANPLGEQFAVHWSRAQTTELIARLVTEAGRAAERIAERALAAHRGDGNDAHVRLIRHIVQRDQFRAGPRANYRIEDARADLLTTTARRRPLHLCLLALPSKLAFSRLKAAGPSPDLAELAMLVRVVELVQALRLVYPPGVERVTLISDAGHFRRFPRNWIDLGLVKMREYARAVTGDLVELAELSELATRAYSRETMLAHADLRAAAHRVYTDMFADLDIATDPVGALRVAAARDTTRTIADMFRSLLHSVPVPEPAHTGMDQAAWSVAIYEDVYDVGVRVEPAVRRARQEVLRTTWRDALEYASVWHADDRLGFRRRFFPDAMWMSSRPGPGRVGFGPLGHGPAPWHGTGVIDARGSIGLDFLVSLRDQGFVPLYSPLLGGGDGQPLAMVPVTATLVGAGGANELAPEFTASIKLRPK